MAKCPYLDRWSPAFCARELSGICSFSGSSNQVRPRRAFEGRRVVAENHNFPVRLVRPYLCELGLEPGEVLLMMRAEFVGCEAVNMLKVPNTGCDVLECARVMGEV